MNPYIIVKDELAKVKQETTDELYMTFQLFEEEGDVQEDVKFNPETILLDKFTVNSSTTHEEIDCNSCSYVTSDISVPEEEHFVPDKVVASKEEAINEIASKCKSWTPKSLKPPTSKKLKTGKRKFNEDLMKSKIKENNAIAAYYEYKLAKAKEKIK